MSVISTSTIIQNTGWAEPALQAELEGQANDEIARWVGRSPDRFIGSFTLPLRDLDLALAELARCTGDLDLRVANLPAAVDGVYLGAPDFRPLWEALLDLGVVAFIHPDGTYETSWFQEYSACGTPIGQPIDEAKVMASLILRGCRWRIWPDAEDRDGARGRLSTALLRSPRSQRDEHAGQRAATSPASRATTCAHSISTRASTTSRSWTRSSVASDPIGSCSAATIRSVTQDPVGFVRRSQSITERDVELICGSTASSLLSR